MAILKASKQIYEFSLEDMKALIAADLNVNPNAVDVQYTIGDIGLGDPMDRYPAPRGVKGVRVTVNNPEQNTVRNPLHPKLTSSLASQIDAVESKTSQWGDH